MIMGDVYAKNYNLKIIIERVKIPEISESLGPGPPSLKDFLDVLIIIFRL